MFLMSGFELATTLTRSGYCFESCCCPQSGGLLQSENQATGEREAVRVGLSKTHATSLDKRPAPSVTTILVTRIGVREG